MLDFLKSYAVDLFGLCRELAKSSLAFALVAVVALDAWRKRITPPKFIGALLGAYIVSIFCPANCLGLLSQKQWYELNGWVALTVWGSHIEEWHLDDAFLSGRALTLAVTFYATILIGSDKWYKTVGRAVGLWLLLVGLAICSLCLMIQFELPKMIPSTGPTLATFVWYYNLPVVCAANAMCAILFSIMIYELVKRQPGITRTRLLFHVVCPIIVFVAALVSLEVLSFWKGVLWLVSMIVLYAPVLSAIRINLAGDRNLLDMYVKGASTILGRTTGETT